eukprot:TRINITY_DN3773_c0_g1_i1.p1 TRINITY_DN3773_c0_g1~~TRINITY_DN3773_c0_g1_i1.p1  ORF type:complete len:169 (+),score=51.12 TRINITY_DN3773_c0_g1_i1:446-952(+)
MGETFKIQISSDLIRRLADEDKKKPRKPKTKTAKSGLDTEKSQVEAKQSHDTVQWQPGLPPKFLPEAFVSPVDKEVDSLRKTLVESERVIDKLQKEEGRMLSEVKQNAMELHEKEFKMPKQKPVPCLTEKQACLHCYKEHRDDPLQCAVTVKTFLDCARQAKEHFLGS